MLLPRNTPTRRGFHRRLHNRRIGMIITDAGEYQIHIRKYLPPGEAEQMRKEGHVDTLDNQIIRDRIWYSVITLTGETLDVVHELKEKLEARRQRKR